MLDIIWGRENVPKELVPKVVMDSRIFFRKNKKPVWFEDPFVKEFLLEIDRAQVLFQEALLNYKGEGFSTTELSTGSKTLCCIRFEHNRIFYGGQLGDNCLPFLVRMAEERDIVILLEHYADFTPEDIAKGVIRCHGVIVDQDGYDDAFSDWSASTQEDNYEQKVYNCGL